MMIKKACLALLVSMFLFAGMAAAAERPVTNDPTEALFTTYAQLGLEPPAWLLTETPQGANTAVYLNCSNFDSSYCTYKLNKFSMCCVPIWVAPGAYCPNICI